MLVLPIKKKWFNMIKSGEKKEEYREHTEYYCRRFTNNFVDLKTNEIINNYIIFRNGYRKDSSKIKCLCSIDITYGKPEWGAEPNKLYYVLKILNVEEIK